MSEELYKYKYKKYKAKCEQLKKNNNIVYRAEKEYILYQSKNLSHHWACIKQMIEDEFKNFLNQWKDAGVMIGLDNMKRSNIISKIFGIVSNLPIHLYDGKGGTVWQKFSAGEIETDSAGKVRVTLDAFYAQILFFTTYGFMRIIIYPKEILANPTDKIPSNSNIYIKITKDLQGELKSNEIISPIQLNNLNDDNYFIADFKKLVNHSNGVTVGTGIKDRSMKNVLEFMYNEYSTKARPFIAILGKARFLTTQNNTRGYAAINAREDTYEIFSNLLFRNCNLGFISGGYKGKSSNMYGITRSGYEMAKHFEKPSVVIMCNAGLVDSHMNADAKGLYGVHWGDDTTALSVMADAGIFIAPFGAWTYIELASLTYRNKPVAIYFNARLFSETNDYEKIGYGKGDHRNITELLESKENKNDAGQVGADPATLWGVFYLHYDNNKKYGIPVFDTYSGLAEFILRKLGTACDYTTKARLLGYALGKDFKTPTTNKLNRQIKVKLNDETGIYEEINLERPTLLATGKPIDFCKT